MLCIVIVIVMVVVIIIVIVRGGPGGPAGGGGMDSPDFTRWDGGVTEIEGTLTRKPLQYSTVNQTATARYHIRPFISQNSLKWPLKRHS